MEAVLSFLDGQRSLRIPVTPPSLGAAPAVSSLSFGAVEQALRLIRHAAPTIRIRATRILITRSGPQPARIPPPHARIGRPGHRPDSTGRAKLGDDR